MRLHVKQLPCDRQTFEAKLAAYLDARAAHRRTVGVPAPFPEYEIFRVIADQGGKLEIHEDEPARELSAEEKLAAEIEAKRAAALRALDEQRLELAAIDPNAPQEVKDYAAALQ